MVETSDPSTLAPLLGESRARVVVHLASEPGATVTDLAAALGLSDNGVRKHLERLVADGLVAERAGVADGPGRPSRTYVLTTAGHRLLPDGHAAIARDLLQFLTDEHGRAGVRDFLRWRLERQAATLADDVDASDDLATRLDGLARALSDAGFAARVVPTDDGFELVQTHCTIRDLAEEHPALCAYEAASFQRVLGPEVQVSRRSTIANGQPACVCRVHAPAPATAAPPAAPQTIPTNSMALREDHS